MLLNLKLYDILENSYHDNRGSILKATLVIFFKFGLK